MLAFDKVTEDDIDFIINSLWARGEEEAVLYGLKTKDEVKRYLLGVSKNYGFVLRAPGEEPVAAFGAESYDGRNYNTWFIATERFTEQALGITKFLRGFIKERLAERPDAQLNLISAVGHPDAVRWFNALGFDRVKINGVFSTYRYVGIQKRVDLSLEKQDDT